ncbi:MAG: hypothetical protein IKZ49_01530 [Alphaproteobacteria bacterium]|nr:hypothetical protein [Alphaproteobacteria bacterium]
MNNKTQKMKKATRNTRKKNIKQWLKKVITFPIRLCKAIWNWLKSIDIIGMINLTLLVAIIVLFSALIVDVLRCDKYSYYAHKNHVVMNADNKAKTNNVVKKDDRKVVQRKFNTALPIKMDKESGIKPQIKVVGVKKPVVVKELSLPASELPKQNLAGDVIVDTYPSSPVLSNGVNIDGNLFIQNMRKYTLPCDANIEGNLFIRNVARLKFCGAFQVKGNIYVNRESSFGPIPSNAKIGGQVIL